jgi:MFS family permease
MTVDEASPAAAPSPEPVAGGTWWGMPKMLFASNFSTFSDSFSELVAILVAPFAITTLFNGDKQDLGWMLSLNSVANAASMIVFGKLSDTLSHSFILLFLNFGTAVSAVYTGSSTSPTQAIVGFTILGLFGASQPVNRTLITLTVPEKDRTMAFGTNSLFLQFATLCAMLTAGLSDAFGLSYALIIYSGAVPGVIALGLTMIAVRDAKISFFRVLEDPADAQKKADDAAAGGAQGDKQCGGMTPLIAHHMFLFFLFHFAGTSQTSVNALTFQQVFSMGLGETTIFVFAYLGFCALMVGTLLKPITDRFGPDKTAAIGCVLAALGSIGTCLLEAPLTGLRGLPLITFNLVFSGIGGVLLGSNIFAVFVKLLPKGQEGVFMGINSTVGSLARAIAPAMGVYLFVQVKWWAPYAVGSATYLLMAVLYLAGEQKESASEVGVKLM